MREAIKWFFFVALSLIVITIVAVVLINTFAPGSGTPTARWLNLSYFFFLIYTALTWPFRMQVETGAFFTALKVISGIISLVAIVAIIYLQRLKAGLSRVVARDLYTTTNVAHEEDKAKNTQWERLVRMVDGDNPSEWKIAVLEADKLLEAATLRMASGDSLGERLKNIEGGNYNTVQSAWEAHKIRNRIAHEPDHILTKREARRAMHHFEQVFHEFGII